MDLLVRFLQQRELPDDLEALTYTILETYLQGNSRKNELYFTKYLDFFLLQVEEEVSLLFTFYEFTSSKSIHEEYLISHFL